jgi:septal ring factor EnvC (AmiA/AmiB activator)
MRSIALAVLLCALCGTASAQNRRQAEERLDSLRQQLDTKRARLDQLGETEGDVLGKLQDLEETIDLNKRVVDRLRDREQRVEGEIVLADSLLTVRESLLVEVRASYARRLVSLSKNELTTPPDWLFFLADPGQAALTQPLLAAVGRADRRLIREYDSLRTAVARDRGILIDRKDELHGLQKDKQRETRLLAAGKEKRSHQLKQIRSERSQLADAMQELVEAAQRLEALINELVASGAASYGGDGRHVKRAKGRLPWPVDGKVVEGFGFRIVGPRKAKVPHNGLSIEAPEGTEVTAVADGAVSYIGRLRGYGEMVILDHGGGYFSLYGHLEEASCFAGQIVLQGDPVGKVGESGSLSGPQLYFELRENRVQVDPLPWLKP